MPKNYRRYVNRNPKDKSGHYNLAVTLEAAHQVEPAILSYCRAIEIDPWYPEALNNLGILLHSKGNLPAARQCFARALASRPGYEDAEYNLATLESNAGNYQDAVFHFSRVLERNPSRANAWNNLGNALLALRSPAEALQAFQLALGLQPGFPDAQWNSSVAQLTLGKLPEGWNGFELRGQLRHGTLPRWNGSDIPGKQILVHAEQGLGDTIQFARYCGQVKKSGAHITLECHPQLLPLLQCVPGVDTFVGFGTSLPHADFQVPLMSLPLVFHSALEDISGTRPYLSADPNLLQEWRIRMVSPPRHLKVGLVWAGNPGHRNDHNRSISPDLLSALEQPENVSFFSLQQKPQSKSFTGIQFAGIYDELTFSDTAAIIANLDLVISVDTAVAHLAGALGKTVWNLLPFAPDWRWMLERSDTPWYPTMRLFRQPRLNDWPSVLHSVGSELKQLANSI
ncbi:MAG: tetratricopeptide repeat protein [Acidobacteriota bacterium]|nr:tetratricopeptide repeat protein [Acidobacteriota bacterium]